MAREQKILKRWLTPKSDELIAPLYLWIGLIIIAVFTLGPFLYLLTSSLSNKVELLSGHLFPHHPTFNNYVRLFTGSGASDFIRAIRNSIVVAALTTIFSIAIGMFAAYGFARIRFPFRMTALFIILAIQTLPATSVLVPMYVMMRNGIQFNLPFTHIILFQTPPLLDTIWALVISNTTFSLPFVIWLLSGYFQAVPKELEESAGVDGSSRMGIMFKIVLPLSMPGISATSIFTFLNAWDQFMFPNALTETYASKTLPIAINEFVSRHAMDWGLMTAGGLIAVIPPVLMSLFFYRYIVGGMLAGGLKG